MFLHISVLFLSNKYQENVFRGCLLLETRWTNKHRHDETGRRIVVTVLGEENSSSFYSNFPVSFSWNI